jgi:hypothetical protein
MQYEGASKPERDQPGFRIYVCCECDELTWLKDDRGDAPRLGSIGIGVSGEG